MLTTDEDRDARDEHVVDERPRRTAVAHRSPRLLAELWPVGLRHAVQGVVGFGPRLMVSAAYLLDADEEGQCISALNTQKLRWPSGTLHGEGVHDAGRALAFRAEHGLGHSVLVTSSRLHAAENSDRPRAGWEYPPVPTVTPQGRSAASSQ